MAHQRDVAPRPGRPSRRWLSATWPATALLVLAACGGDPPTPELAPEAMLADTATLSAEAIAIAGLTTDTVRLAPWEAAVQVPARVILDPARVETLGSITEGRITEVLVRVGDRVQAGAPLVLIHSHEIMDARSAQQQARAAVTAAEAERTLAMTQAERAARLLAAKAMSQADVDRAVVARTTAQAAYDQALAERDRADALVEHLVGTGPMPPRADPHDVIIRAPIAGVITGREAQPGTVVLPGQPLLTLGDPSALLLQMHVPERDGAAARVGASVQVMLTEQPGQRTTARVTRVAPTVDTLTRTIEVLAAFTGNAVRPRAEAFAQAELRAGDGSRALVVPQGAVQALEGDTIVIATTPRGAGVFIEAIPVRVGRRSGGMAEILSGLEAGRAVVVGGAAIAKAELLKRRTGGEVE